MNQPLLIKDFPLGITGVRCAEVYYPDSIKSVINQARVCGYDIVNIVHVSEEDILSFRDNGLHVYQKTSTIRLDISQNVEILLQGFSATLRNHCRNGLSSPDLPFNVYQPSEGEIFNFQSDLANFYYTKLKINTDLSFHYNHHFWLGRYRNLFYSDTFFKGILIKRHSYLVHHRLARLLNSVQIHLNQDFIDKKVASFSNTASHFNDIIFFKKIGIDLYDLGGVYSDMRDGVSQYKQKFSKAITNLLDVFIPVSDLGNSCMPVISSRYCFNDHS